MTPLTDDDLGELLNETFSAHEHLADPDRARQLAAGGGTPRSHRRPVLLAAAAAVALVVGGTSYLVSGRDGAGPSAGPLPLGPGPSYAFPVQSRGVTHAQAVAAAERAIARVPVFADARVSNAGGVPELRGPTMTSSPPGYTVTRARWWTVSGTTPTEVARWYAGHPARGFVSDSGRRFVSSTSGTGLPTIDFVTFHQPGASSETPVGVRMVVETTTTSGGVGVRATVESVWSPPRADPSYARDVTSIDVLLTTRHYGRHVHSSRHRWTIADPASLARVVTAFNRLYGNPPVMLPCPMMVSQVEYRVVFHSPGGDLVARVSTGCGAGVRVSRDGTVLPPALAAPAPLVKVLEAAR